MRSKTWLKLIGTALLDCLFCWLSWALSIFIFSYMFLNDYAVLWQLNKNLWFLIPIWVFSFIITGVYYSLWQHPGIGSVLRLGTSVLLSSFSVYVSLHIRMGFWSNPGLGVLAFYFLLTFSLTIRLFPRVFGIVRQYLSRMFRITIPEQAQIPIRTLIIGAGESASAFLQNGSQHGSRPREIIGVLDNDPRKQGYSLHGVRILGDDSMIPKLCRELEINEIIVAVPTMKNEDLKRIIKLIPIKRCKIRVLAELAAQTPYSGELLHDLDIGDLLGRSETQLDMQNIDYWIKDKTVLVTGGGGSIGSELCRLLLKFDPKKIVIYDISENNAYNLKEELALLFGQKGKYRVAIRIGSVQDEARLDMVFDEFNPSIVFHAAAYKHVPLMEECPRLAIENNVLGTFYSASCAKRHGVKRFIMISTDKAVNPTNIMGATKRLAELITLSLNEDDSTEFVCVRFGNVLGSNGSVVPLFKRQIEAGGPVTITHPEIVRYFMTIPEAARLVVEAGAIAQGGEIFILDMGNPVKIMDLAENLIRMAGMIPEVDIKIVCTGLRPGEKLYEELLLNEEGLGTTQNNKIFVARPEPMDANSRTLFFEKLKQALNNREQLIDLLKHYIPEYTYTPGAFDVEHTHDSLNSGLGI